MKTLVAFIIISAFALVNVKGDAYCTYSSYFFTASCYATATGGDGDYNTYTVYDNWYIGSNYTIRYAAEIWFYHHWVQVLVWDYEQQKWVWILEDQGPYGEGSVLFGPFYWRVVHYNTCNDTGGTYLDVQGTIDSGIESPWYVGASTAHGMTTLTCQW